MWSTFWICLVLLYEISNILKKRVPIYLYIRQINDNVLARELIICLTKKFVRLRFSSNFVKTFAKNNKQFFPKCFNKKEFYKIKMIPFYLMKLYN